ncbi:MAG: hypothetical protein ABFS56_35705 [Pseudomonadota bacterium]
MIKEAISFGSGFNLIHLDTMIKVDVFISKDEPYHRSTFQRRRKDTLEEDDSLKFYIVSPEDIILNKLDWFRLGGQVSDQQWRDIQGVLKIQRDLLDMEYLFRWAKELRLDDLLKQALRDAGISYS